MSRQDETYDWRRFCVNHKGYSGPTHRCPACNPGVDLTEIPTPPPEDDGLELELRLRSPACHEYVPSESGAGVCKFCHLWKIEHVANQAADLIATLRTQRDEAKKMVSLLGQCGAQDDELVAKVTAERDVMRQERDEARRERDEIEEQVYRLGQELAEDKLEVVRLRDQLVTARAETSPPPEARDE